MSDERRTEAPSSDDNLVSLAPMLGLDALGPAELDSVERRRAKASDIDRTAFDRDVRRTRETMASVSSATSAAPPPELRARLLHLIQNEPQEQTPVTDEHDDPPASPSGEVVTFPARRRIVYLAAAAIVAVAIGAVGWAIGANLSSSDDTPQQTTAQQVFDAKDIRTASGTVASGRATVAYSESADAGVLVMNDVPPPKSGTVYQMWLVGPEGATSAGTMTDKDVAPSTTAVIQHIGGARSLAFSVEPPGGSKTPTGSFVAELPLT